MHVVAIVHGVLDVCGVQVRGLRSGRAVWRASSLRSAKEGSLCVVWQSVLECWGCASGLRIAEGGLLDVV